MSAALKRLMPVGSVWQATHHQPVPNVMGLRRVKQHRSKDMIFDRIDKDGNVLGDATLSYPKADKLVSNGVSACVIKDFKGDTLLSYSRVPA